MSAKCLILLHFSVTKICIKNKGLQNVVFDENAIIEKAYQK